jgi:chromate transport protein ChrA
MRSNKLIYPSIFISIILAVVINLIPSKNFFGPYYIDLYIIIPLILVQLLTLLFKKYITWAVIINALIVVIMSFIAYKCVINS